MPYVSPLSDSAALLQSARDAVAHFKQIGVDLEKGRFQRYERIIRDITKGCEVNRAALVNATCEINDLAAGCRLHPDILRMNLSRMHLLGKGADSYAQSGDSDPGRDVGFEIFTASVMHACGGAPTINDPSDVACEASGQRVLIECKRPTSLGSFRRRLKEAHDQLAGHRANGINGVGAIAVDVSVLLNPECGVLECENARDGLDTLRAHMRRLRQQAASDVQGYYRDRPPVLPPLVTALMFRMQCGLVVNNALVVANAWDIEPLIKVSEPSFLALYHLVQSHPASTPGVHTENLSDSRLTPREPQ